MPVKDIIKDVTRGKRYYSKEKADRVIKFISLLKHTKGKFAGKFFILKKWQEKEIRKLFGTVWEDGTRCYRTGYFSTARKNGKTEMGAAIALYMLCGDGEMGAEIYSAAGDKEQASLVFNAAAYMVRTNKTLSKKLRIIPSQKRIVYPKTNSFYRVISADADLKHGFNAHCVIYDELHVARNRELWEALSTSMGARQQPLMLAFTTAGYNIRTICHEQYLIASKILSGELKDPTYFAYIAETTEKDDWKSIKTWKKANPNLGISVELKFMKSQFERAKNNPAEENSFRRFHLNQWTSSNVKWIPHDIWIKSAGKVNHPELSGKVCVGGLDLSTIIDITAFVLDFPMDDGIIKMLPTFWIPEENMRLRSHRDRVPYELWYKQGFLKVTPGNVVDYGFIKKNILQLAETYKIRDIAFDRWNAHDLVQQLEGDGLEMIEFRQGFPSFNSPTKEFEACVRRGKLHHGNNPIMDWMVGNVQLKIDAAGNVKPDKHKSTEKIDGAVAAIMAYDRIIRSGDGNDSGDSVYKERGIITF